MPSSLSVFQNNDIQYFRRRPFREQEQEDATIAIVVAACFTLNYIMGTGILTIPWAFHDAGVVLSCLSLTIVCLLGIMSSAYLLSAMTRAEALNEYVNNIRVHGSTRDLFASVESTPLHSASGSDDNDDEDDDDNANRNNGSSIDDNVIFSLRNEPSKRSLLTVENSRYELDSDDDEQRTHSRALTNK